MAKPPDRPRYTAPPPKETAELLREELHRRGMSQAEIDQALRKKKRQRVIAFNAVKHPHVRSSQAYSRKPRAREPHVPPARDLVTVETAAQRLQLHPKTVLRMIREGRLAAKRIGKAYRIQTRDLDAFAGVTNPSPGASSGPVQVTTIVDLPGVGEELARLWAQSVTTALNAKPAGPPFRADVIHEPDREHLKIVIVGGPADVGDLLKLIEIWRSQLSERIGR